MTEKQRTWRFASLLAVALIVGTTTATQAGVIPWVYDAVFGPVRYPVSGSGYSAYSASYAPTYYARRSGDAPVNYGYVSTNYGYESSRQSAGCSSCSTSYYAPVNYAPSYGYGCGCGPVAVAPSCGPCGVACGTPSNSCDSGCSIAPTNAKPAPSNGTSNGFHPTKKEPAANRNTPPKAQTETFVTPSNRSTTDVEPPTNDGLGASGRTRGLRTDDAVEESNETLKPVPTETETVIPKAKKVPPPTDVFEGDQDQSPENSLDPIKKTDGEAKIQLPLPKVNLDDKIAWRAEAPRTRVPFHAKTAKVSVVRRVPSLNNDWTPVVAKPNGPQLVKK